MTAILFTLFPVMVTPGKVEHSWRIVDWTECPGRYLKREKARANGGLTRLMPLLPASRT